MVRHVVRFLSLLTVVLAFLFGAAQAGKLDHGAWTPTRCGPEPMPPAGMFFGSRDAFNESMKQAKLYQDEYTKFSDCMNQEADADNLAMNEGVHASEHRAQEFFDKVQADSKRARSDMSGNDSGISMSQHPHSSSSVGPSQ